MITMSVARRVLSLAVFSQGVLGGLYPGLSTANHTCNLVEPVLSCSENAQPGLVDTCCAETFGGLVLQTQFWNTYTGLESKGQLLPKDSWTIHGLWPDFCNGSYTQYCDLKRQYDPEPSPNTTTGTPAGKPVKPWKGEPISDFIKDFRKYDLLAYMNKFWTGLNQPSWYLWAHEFSKHATCFSSFDTECYGPSYLSSRHEEVIDFFGTVIAYYQTVPTWRWLAEGGITPCNKTAYAVADIQGAIRARFGKIPYVGCSGPRYNETAAGKGSKDNGFTVLSEMWYYHHVRGRVQRVQGVPVDASGSVTNCAKAPKAIWYYERTPHSVAA
ncbi:ribonuclease T2 family protein [Xylaria cf. heliscus]|nr:ribonuclease T2 family protein [Xylaria cf. heliscus]